MTRQATAGVAPAVSTGAPSRLCAEQRDENLQHVSNNNLFKGEHPLDPLSPSEITAVAAACKAYATANAMPPLRFNAITLQEPPKAALLEALAGRRRLPRHALAILEIPSTNTVAEALLRLAPPRAAVLEWTPMVGVQPTVSVDDASDAEAIMKGDAAFRALVAERYGITDVSMLAVDPWYCGERFATRENTPVGRQMMLWLYVRLGDPDDNFYAHPLDLVVDIDLNSRRVVKMFCYDQVPQIPQLPRNYHRRLLDRPFRADVKPLHVLQPEGPSFAVAGNIVTWQKWRFHLGFNFKEGIVLSDISYTDQGRARPILYRASVAEVIVPYADPRMPYARKCAFDAVDYGLGQCASSLQLGCDCLGHIHYFDAHFCSKGGEPYTVPSAVCVHEEDAGLAWKHVEYRTNHNEVRRMRRLVASFVATIANYEYGFYYSFYQDGTIAFEVKLTGIISTNVYRGEDGTRPAHGQLVAPLLNAQHHQHFFCFRIDPAVDDPSGGGALTVVEQDCEPLPLGADNPHGVAFRVVETALRSEQGAQRVGSVDRSRVWKVKNPAVLNPLNGEPVSYKLVPFPSPPLYCHPTSTHGARGVWAQKHLWVTQHKDGELYPAGQYPLQVTGATGIDTWTQQDRKVEGADVVLWYNLGVTHVVRIEDMPVMPVEVIGFQLKPVNFFDMNPAIDLPPLRNELSRDNSAPSCCVHSKL